jgi:hypothetical protein
VTAVESEIYYDPYDFEIDTSTVRGWELLPVTVP